MIFRKQLSRLSKVSLVCGLLISAGGCVSATLMPSVYLLETSPKTAEEARLSVRQGPSVLDGYFVNVAAPMSFGSAIGADYSHYELGTVSKTQGSTRDPEQGFLEVTMVHTQYNDQKNWRFPDKLSWRGNVLNGRQSASDVDCGFLADNHTSYCVYNEVYRFDLSVEELNELGRWGGEMVLVGQGYTERLAIPSFYASALLAPD